MTHPDLTKPHRLLRRSHFWEIQVDGKTVLTRHGKGMGISGGRGTSRHFPGPQEAVKWAQQAFLDKLAEGYISPEEFEKQKQTQNEKDPEITQSPQEQAELEHPIRESKNCSIAPDPSSSQSDHDETNNPQTPNSATPDSSIRRSGRKRTAPMPFVASSASRQRPRHPRQSLHTAISTPEPADSGSEAPEASVSSPTEHHNESALVASQLAVISSPSSPSTPLSATSPTQAKAKTRRKQTKRLGFAPHQPVGGKAPSHKKQRRVQRAPPSSPTNGAFGVIDQCSGVENGSIHTETTSSGERIIFDVLLVFIEKLTDTDKFVVLQLIHTPTTETAYILYEKTGRTGSSGQSLRIDFGKNGFVEARLEFTRRFQSYTSLEWQNRFSAPIPGKHRNAKQDFDLKYKTIYVTDPHWQYWVDNGSGGKPTEWLDYNEEDSMLAEELHIEFFSNPWLGERIVQNGSHFDLVNLVAKTTTEVGHPNSSVHHFRRVAAADKNEAKRPDNKSNPSRIVSETEATDVKPMRAKSYPRRQTFSSSAKIVRNGSQKKSVTSEAQAKSPHSADLMTNESTISKVQSSLPVSVPEIAVPTGPPAAVINAAMVASTAMIPDSVTSSLPASAVPIMPPASGAGRLPDDPCGPFPGSMSVVQNHARSQLQSLPGYVDRDCPNAHAYRVMTGWDVTLDESDACERDRLRRFLRLQLLFHPSSNKYFVWTRRSKNGGTSTPTENLFGPLASQEHARDAFQNKFKEATGSKWLIPNNTEESTGKAIFSPMPSSADISDGNKRLLMNLALQQQSTATSYPPSNLPTHTRELLDFLFDANVRISSLTFFGIDLRRLPLDQLSANYIQQGVSVLQEIENALAQGPTVPRTDLQRLSAKFYTVFPHEFANRPAPLILNIQMLQRCYDMCNIMLHLVETMALLSAARKRLEGAGEQKPQEQLANQLYDSLNTDIKLVLHGSEEYTIVSEAFHRTKGANTAWELLQVWRVNRSGEAERFSKLNMTSHALLWHGSHIGSVPSVLANGLRILPHSRGRLGRGIYCASESGKSLQTTIPDGLRNVGCMFLVQVALGRSYEVFEDPGLLFGPPHGFNSVRACGRQAPAGYKTVRLDGDQVHSITVAVMESQPKMDAVHSRFSSDEFVVYNEAQTRLRYLVTVKKAVNQLPPSH